MEINRVLCCTALLMCQSLPAYAVEPAAPATQSGATQGQAGKSNAQTEVPPKSVLDLAPNRIVLYRYQPVIPMSSEQKITAAARRVVAPANFIIPSVTAALSQAADKHPAFGQGMSGYGKRYGAAFADRSISGFMRKGLYPALLHEDPRYYAYGEGGAMARATYAASRVFITRTDEGRSRFNTSEVAGRATALAISSAYYPDEAGAMDHVKRIGLQFLLAAGINVAREFWPDIRDRISRNRSEPPRQQVDSK
jgi:hypothetical protein